MREYKMIKIKLIIIVILLSFFNSCFYSRVKSISVSSTSQEITSEYEIIGEAEGFSSEFRLLWVIPVTPRMSLEDAVNEAIRSKGGNAMIEMTAKSEKQRWIVGSIDGIRVQGKVIRFTNK